MPTPEFRDFITRMDLEMMEPIIKRYGYELVGVKVYDIVDFKYRVLHLKRSYIDVTVDPQTYEVTEL